MSQSLVYLVPERLAPPAPEANWEGEERRSRDPVDRLSRSLNDLCLEASDPYEIVAHLEALGFNSSEALARLGVDSHFELAKALYERTPKVRGRRRARAPRVTDWYTPLAMAAAFVVTFLLGAFDGVMVLVPSVVVLIWSQVGAALLARARAELGSERHAAVVSALLWLGLASVGVAWVVLRFGVGAMVPVLLWAGVAGLLWAERPRQALAIPALVGVAMLAVERWGAEPVLPHALAVGLVVGLCLPLLLRPAWRATIWLGRNVRFGVYPLLYGAGQACLVVALLRSPPREADIVPGALLLLAILLFSQEWLVRLKTRLLNRLWKVSDDVRYAPYAQRALAGYVAAYLAPAAVALAVRVALGPQPWLYYWQAFGLFGLCLGLAMVAFTLGHPAAAGVTFALAGIAALAGAPFLPLTGLIAVGELVLMLRRVGFLEEYAIHLL